MVRSLLRRRLRLGLSGQGSVREQLTAPERLVQFLSPSFAGLDREMGLLVALDSRAHLIDVVTISIGGLDHTSMGPREIYRDALLLGAATIAVAHNHPSGDPTPSPSDRVVTRRLGEAGRTMGVPLIDHLIVGGPDEWRSFARSGLL